MSENQRVYKKIYKTLKKQMKGTKERFVIVIAMMMTGLLKSELAQLPKMAKHAPSEAQNKSITERFARLMKNQGLDVQVEYTPFAKQLLNALCSAPLTIVLDGSQVGKGCMTLMVCVVYKQRALPLTWIVYEGKKGHAPVTTHIEALELLQPLVPQGAEVVIVGDGEYDNIDMFKWVEDKTSWKYLSRTRKDSLVYDTDAEQKQLQELGPEKGWAILLEDTWFTGQEFGPLQAMVWWDEEYDEPIYLVSNLSDSKEIRKYYRRRPKIETFFSDQKSRGFGIDKSRIENPERLSRLLMIACLCYLWMIALGVEVVERGETRLIARTDRTDLSLFQLGMSWFIRLLKNGGKFNVMFCVPGLSV